jgi:hypothetical protein
MDQGQAVSLVEDEVGLEVSAVDQIRVVERLGHGLALYGLEVSAEEQICVMERLEHGLALYKAQQ